MNEETKSPDVSTYTKVYYSETLTGERTQVSFTEEIPALEEAPEQITASVLDLDYELSRPGIRKAGTIEIPILFTHTQHKRLRDLDKSKEYYWFFQLPENTAETTGKPLVRYCKGTSRLTMDTISVGEFLKDKLTIYKTTAVEETDGFPTVAGN
ncbi:MAG: hypothetical protein Q4D02_01810 [Clostridia bacterium]|nr:hypothetical protein [Clostridia bacterium]